MSITVLDYFTKCGKPPKTDIYDNAVHLLDTVNAFLKLYPGPIVLSSGYRSVEHNIKIGGSKKSAHCTGEAIDILDRDGKLKEWVLAHLKELKGCGLYMEHPSATPSWCHLQIRPTRNNPFRP